MTEVTEVIVELDPVEYERLREEALRLGKTPKVLVQEWVNQRLQQSKPDLLQIKEKAIEALRAAGLLVEISPELQKKADLSVPIEEVQEALGRGGKSLSQIVLEGREPEA